MQSQSAPNNPKPTRRHRAALIAILSLAVFLHFFRLDQEGFANTYYAAAVKSMLMSWHNFFFASFDPAGFVSVDKPPLGLWVQALSARVLGFSGFSLLLPQALAGVLSVALLYHLVQRVFGPGAGLIAALTLALSPISVAANRNNTMDGQLVLICLLAVWAVTLATERGRLRWLFLCAVLLGLGFNIKMLQAYMVLPACFLLYFLAARLPWSKRLVHLALATLVLLAVSFSWALLVDSIPPEARPFVGSSRDNTVMELVIGHNGAARLGQIAGLIGLDWQRGRPATDRSSPPGKTPPTPPSPPTASNAPAAGFRDETGAPGIGRLFNRQLAGQIAWFLPAALLSALAIAWSGGTLWPLTHRRQALVLWVVWLLPQAVFFSYAGLFHRYYLEMMAPAIAALLGGGLISAWQDYRAALIDLPDDSGRRRVVAEIKGWLLPAVVLLALITQLAILNLFPGWQTWLGYLVGGWTLIALLGLVGLRLVAPALRGRQGVTGAELGNFSRWLSAAGILSLMIIPAAWSLTPLIYGGESGLPFAGPELAGKPRPAATPQFSMLNKFLLQARDGETFILATRNAREAAPLILSTGQAVMAVGGFSGSDQILTAGQLARIVGRGEVRFFLIPAPQARPPNSVPPGGNLLPQQPPGRPDDPLAWVKANCRPIPNQAWKAPAGHPGEPVLLLDCAILRRP